jgi:Transcriptional regulator
MSENKRRNPKQGRAQATFNAILEATLQILEAEGEARLTTNHIAERAGVSIGTLYQYFSDRDEILAELGHREAESVRNRISEIVSKNAEQADIRAIVRALMEGGKGKPQTRMILSETLIKVRGESVLGEHHLAFLKSVSDLPGKQRALTNEQAFILTQAAISLLRAAAAQPALGLDRKKLEDELVRLMESYLGALG